MQPKVEVEQTTEREKEYRDLLQRVQADFINYKHRVEEEREGQAKFAKADLILKLLPLLDDFRRAGKTMPEATANSDWAQGIKLVEKKLAALLEEEGVSKIDAEGKDFDPREHDAISYEESDKYEEGKV
ncbi:MAG: nucleotide exchange factor GrpE, partial [Dehalococcoidia bacterium]|nr:nucleotide exchange factor GrpE [Dehalococcoidia bacterium]